MLVDEQIQGFKVNIKAEKKSKLSSVVLKIRGIDQVTQSCFPSFHLYSSLDLMSFDFMQKGKNREECALKSPPPPFFCHCVIDWCLKMI